MTSLIMDYLVNYFLFCNIDIISRVDFFFIFFFRYTKEEQDEDGLYDVSSFYWDG